MTSDMHALAAAYSLDALDAAESAEFEQHLAACDTCSLDVREMRETAAVLALTSLEEPPAALRDAVLARVRLTSQGSPDSDAAAVVDLAERRTRRGPATRWLTGVAAAAVLVAGGLGVTTYQASQRADQAQLASDQITALLADPEATVERADVTGGGAGTLVASPSRSQAAFLAASLPVTGPDETYQLWAIDDQGATSVGLLQPDSGQAIALVDLPPGTTTFGMSVEPAGGSPAPTTDPVLLVELSA
ncbi:MAG: anti-sigma factor [Actinomycetia bacterium]|nr:anti-sigma factor [Actinomycetes bacterium]